MDGQLGIHEAERLLERNDLGQGDNYHTLAGFVLWHLGRLPAAGDTLTWRDLRIEIVDMDGTRIDKVLLRSRALAPQPDSIWKAPRWRQTVSRYNGPQGLP